MAELTAEQRDFLKYHGVDESEAFDASGMSRNAYQYEMKRCGALVAYGVSPCKDYGHQLRKRSGHCVQCHPEGLSYLRRMDVPAYVYVAFSDLARLIKVGSSGRPYGRDRALRSEFHGGADDWVLIEVAHCVVAGRAEFEVHELLAGYSVSGLTYLKEGRVITCREVFSCPPAVALDCVRRTVAKFG